MAANITTLAVQGNDFTPLSMQHVRAARIFLMASILKQGGGHDYTNMTSLLDEMEQYHGLSDYQRQAAYLQVARASLIASGAPIITPAQFFAAVNTGASRRPQTLFSGEIAVLNELTVT